MSINMRSRNAAPVVGSPNSEVRKQGLTIRVSRGTGIGSTRLAAFDSALRAAGVADFNLVRLSSVIPPHSIVLTTGASEQIRGGHGDLLYCVYADAYTSTPGETAWAGMTWALNPDAAGGGLFAEHTGLSRTSVERELEHTMDEMVANRRGAFDTRGTLLSSVTCETHPVCAIVLASYGRTDWSDRGAT